jgi:hypothetical protein
LTPQRAAKEASLLIRSGLSPAGDDQDGCPVESDATALEQPRGVGGEDGGEVLLQLVASTVMSCRRRYRVRAAP